MVLCVNHLLYNQDFIFLFLIKFLNELKRNERVPYSVQFVLNENGGHKFRFDHHHHHRKLEANNLFIFNDEDEDGNGGGGKSCLTR